MAIGLVVGSQLPKSGTAGYVVITGTTKNRGAAKTVDIEETRNQKEIRHETLFIRNPFCFASYSYCCKGFKFRGEF